MTHEDAVRGGLDNGGDRGRPRQALEGDHLNTSPNEVGRQRRGPGVAGAPSHWQTRIAAVLREWIENHDAA